MSTPHGVFFLLQSKGQAVEFIQFFVHNLVTPLTFFIHRLCADLKRVRREFFPGVFLSIAYQAGVRRNKDAATNPTMSAPGNDACGDHPLPVPGQRTTSFFVGRGVMKAAFYLAKNTQHSATGISTPQKVIHGKGSTLNSIKTIGARAFMHHETKPKSRSLTARPGRGIDSKKYSIYTSVTRAFMVSKNVMFIETPLNQVPPPSISDSTVLDEGSIAMLVRRTPTKQPEAHGSHQFQQLVNVRPRHSDQSACQWGAGRYPIEATPAHKLGLADIRWTERRPAID